MANRNKQEEFEEQAGFSGMPMKVLGAILCIGLAVLTIYMCFATPQHDTAMGAIRGVMRGLSGGMSILLSLMFIWIGALCICSARGRRVHVGRTIMGALLLLCLFTAVQLFSTQNIIDQLTIKNYTNYVVGSYRAGIGGGAIGAVGAYFLHRYLGTWGGLIVIVIIAFVALTAMGITQKAFRFLKNRAEADYDRREEKRRSEEERMFDNRRAEPQRRPQPQSRPPQPQRRPRPRRPRVEDEYMVIDTPAHPRSDKGRTNATLNGGARRPIETPRAEAEEPMEVPKPLRKIRKEQRIEKQSEAAYARATENYQRKTEQTRTAQQHIGQDSAIDPDALFDVPEVPPEEVRVPEAPPAMPKRGATVTEGVRPLGVNDGKKTIVPDHYDQSENDEPFMPRPKKEERKLEVFEENYNYPPIDLLTEGEHIEDTKEHKEMDREKAEKLIETLRSFGIESRLIGIAHGPAVTRFELQPAPGVKVSRITSLADDIALSLAALSVRIEAPIPGKAAVGVEIPNDKVEMVRLRDVLESPDARRHPSKLAVGLGKDNSGRYIVADIAKMPHVLIAGQTGSGKSVCINSIISSILYRATPDEVRMILIDPKVVELSIYNDIPHLIAPVVTDPKKAASALDWAVAEMTRRYKCFADRGVRDIKGYNKALEKDEKPMPQFVIIIDELADLMMVAPGEVEDSICRLAQLARAAGMHLVIATQRPSVNVITGIIKANIPTRIAFSVASQIDSRTMIDHGGAEKLLGYGDMLYVPSGINKQLRVQGAWISDEEVHAIVSYIKERSETSYDEDMIEKIENSTKSDAEREDEIENEYDPKLAEAVEIVVDAGQASVSMLQRRMRVGYARAGRLIDEMEKRGIVSEAEGAKPRTVLINREQFRNMFGEE